MMWKVFVTYEYLKGTFFKKKVPQGGSAGLLWRITESNRRPFDCQSNALAN